MSKNDDFIPVRVQENGKWVEYRLSYENFSMIQPILDESEHSDVEPDRNSPEMLKEILTSTFAPIARMGEKTILYNLQEKPKEFTLKEIIIGLYKATHILILDSKKTHTQSL